MGLEIPGVRPALFTDDNHTRMVREIVRFRHRLRNLYGEDLDPHKTREVQAVVAQFFGEFPAIHAIGSSVSSGRSPMPSDEPPFDPEPFAAGIRHANAREQQRTRQRAASARQTARELANRIAAEVPGVQRLYLFGSLLNDVPRNPILISTLLWTVETCTRLWRSVRPRPTQLMLLICSASGRRSPHASSRPGYSCTARARLTGWTA